MLTLILGGARSGKSRFAESLAREAEVGGAEIVYIATGQALDAEMQARIAHHRAERPGHWACIEEPLALAATLEARARADRFLMVDCLTLWLTNLMLDADPGLMAREVEALLTTLPALPGTIALVSNEVGMGLVSTDPLGRRFVDDSGRLHQRIAAIADRVFWVVAGCPIKAKG
jgi:adenosylcobinamide kinase/adenosylcobinamide-phosphate guanylyltransferase